MAKNFDTSWFDLNKYDPLRNFDLAKWYFQLSERCYIYKYLFDLDYKESLLEQRDIECLDDGIADQIKRIKENPMLINRYELFFANCEKKVKYKETHYPFNTHSVSNVTLGSLCSVSADLPLVLKNDLATAQYDLWKEPTQEQQELHNLMLTPCSIYLENTISDENSDYEKQPWITVNLRATDEQILNDFKHWLAEYRKEINYFLEPEKTPKKPVKTSKNFTLEKQKEWFRWRVLPCLDLMIISTYEYEKTIPDRIIGDLLFHGFGNASLEDIVKKTTKSKARWLMNEKTINAMYNQVRSQSH